MGTGPLPPTMAAANASSSGSGDVDLKAWRRPEMFRGEPLEWTQWAFLFRSYVQVPVSSLAVAM